LEADWEVEIGGDAPVIDAAWAGLVDLRHSPQLAYQLPEAMDFPSVARVLMCLNAAGSPVWTSKCDVWAMPGAEQLDPDELGSTAEDLRHAWGCYIDLLPRSSSQWNTQETAVSWCKGIIERLHAIPLGCARIDLIVRHAAIAGDALDTGITAYGIGCGNSLEAAMVSLERALYHFVDLLCSHSTVE
jgi:hypothetical protein